MLRDRRTAVASRLKDAWHGSSTLPSFQANSCGEDLPLNLPLEASSAQTAAFIWFLSCANEVSSLCSLTYKRIKYRDATSEVRFVKPEDDSGYATETMSETETLTVFKTIGC